MWPTLYVEARFGRGAALQVPCGAGEIAAYVVEGELAAGEVPLQAGQLAVFESGTTTVTSARSDARVMLLGGERFPTARHIWWNFVASSEERIERAKQRWQERRFPPVPGEIEFMPLPHH
jgi:redox-sensitive bicupin YhaK (pirin superfamily)